MKTRFVLAAVIVILVAIVAAIFYVPYQTSGQQSAEKIRVIVTILPQREFVERVGGDEVTVTVLVGPGADPHTYEPTPSQLRDVAEAKMYAKVGSPIEFEVDWLDRVIATNPNMLVVDCSQGIQLIPMTEHEHEGENHNSEAAGHDHEHEGMDPHIWTSIRNAKIMVQNIHAGLVQVDPTNEASYMKNMNNYLDLLDSLDEKIGHSLAGVENRNFIVFHPAWGYFARDYNLTQIPIEEAGKEPTAASMAILIEEARENHVRVIFASPQFSQKSAEVLASEIGGVVVMIDPLAQDYLLNMEKVAEALAEGMT
jgi:zinc transport system substrate-binding protein